MKITIIGAGNGGQAMAGHFALLGHKVSLYNRTASHIHAIQEQKTILLSEAMEGTGTLHLVTSSLAEALEGAALIMITITADGHRELARKIAPYLAEGQIIVLTPGRTLGAIDFAQTVRHLTSRRVYIAEAQSLIYACRAQSQGHVRIIGIKDKVLLAAWPQSDTMHVLSTVNEVYPCFVQASNVLETSLENIGAILHPAVILFNAAAIERDQPFFFYNDMTPAVAGFLEMLDNERLQTGKALGISLKSLSEWVSFAYSNIAGNSLCEKIKNNPAYYKILAPAALHSRLLLEDIPTGILPMMELARLAGVKTPLMESILNISQALLKKDFTQDGRTLTNLGLSHLSSKDFIHQL